MTQMTRRPFLFLESSSAIVSSLPVVVMNVVTWGAATNREESKQYERNTDNIKKRMVVIHDAE